MSQSAAIAAGHPKTAEAAKIIIQAGGNAFDAAVAAHLAACVAEPVLASLGGGGYLLARHKGQTTLYDFFVQTPRRSISSGVLDFYPITADFGTTRQEFHIGAASIAVPGVVKGLFAIQKELGKLPITVVAEPAISMARQGINVNAFQAYIFEVVSPIYHVDPETFATFRSPSRPGQLIQEGEVLTLPKLADFIEHLALEGDDWFYEGEVAGKIVDLCRQKGGWLDHPDLACYQVIRRRPLALTYRNSRILTNPPPSSGGILIAFALKLLEQFDLSRAQFGEYPYLDLLTRVQEATQRARLDYDLDETHPDTFPPLLDSNTIARYLARLGSHPLCSRGTTHISIMDKDGNIASLTTSNGEGCGYMIPGTGVILNNMLGEEDLNPHGFHQWQPNCRMTSMMAPTLAFLPDSAIALGSGGSNRLRTAILQTLVNLIDFQMPLEEAIQAPRLHFENGLLNLENGFPGHAVQELARHFSNYKQWPGKNLFFGGVHAVQLQAGKFHGFGDPRRGGAAIAAYKP